MQRQSRALRLDQEKGPSTPFQRPPYHSALIPGTSSQQPLGGLLSNLTGMLSGAGVGGLLQGGISELLEKFNQNGRGDVAQSWIGTGPNKDISPPQLREAIGPDVLEKLELETGLSQEEILARLSRELPSAVDKYTPEGRLPSP
ncbi:YidB family protein [Bradyrhizobium barranii]